MTNNMFIYDKLTLSVIIANCRGILFHKLEISTSDFIYFNEIVVLELYYFTRHHLGYERVFLPFCQVADTPFHIQGEDVSRQLLNKVKIQLNCYSNQNIVIVTAPANSPFGYERVYLPYPRGVRTKWLRGDPEGFP